ncbi:MAG: DUF86 domain-containing protein [Candidatus Omnitrophica bacterium]|nr:DUF86 domain-containing protein [Candidatus Omnitrophota bacterium]
MISISRAKKLKLKDYFLKREEVVFAFLFGSQVRGFRMRESDVDMAVYFKPEKGLEYETKRDYPCEDQIHFDLVKLLETDNVDLVVLNRANPVLVSSVLDYGVPLVIKDESLFWEFYILISREAQDFYEFVEDYWKIYQQANSLVPQQRVRLLERTQYLEIELKEVSIFKNLTFETYKADKFQRRNIERWVENIANATIDIAKIILASEKKQMPKSYKEALVDFGLFFGLKEKEARKFCQIAALRNILAHQYLEILYELIRDFLVNILPLYEKLMVFLKSYIKG